MADREIVRGSRQISKTHKTAIHQAGSIRLDLDGYRGDHRMKIYPIVEQIVSRPLEKTNRVKP